MTNSPASEHFVRCFVHHQQDLLSYILALVPNIADAQDILQETALALWNKAAEYEPSMPFMNWASKFAWFQVRKFRMYQARRQRHVLMLSDDALQALVAERTKFEPAAFDRSVVLQQCVEKLSQDDRLLLCQRYEMKVSIRQVAEERGVEPVQLYKRLERIRRILLECIEQSTADEQPNKQI